MLFVLLKWSDDISGLGRDIYFPASPFLAELIDIDDGSFLGDVVVKEHTLNDRLEEGTTEVLATKIPAAEIPATGVVATFSGEILFPPAVPAVEAVVAPATTNATAETNSTAANEGLLDIKAVVKSLLDLSYFLDGCLENDLPEVEEAFHELCGESEGSTKLEEWSAVVLNEVQAFDKTYSRLEDFLDGQVAEVDNLVDLVCGCLVSDPGGEQLISEVLEGALPDVSAIGDGGTMLDLVDYCLSNSNSALKSVMSRIRPAATATAAPNAAPTVALKDTAIVLVCMSLQQSHDCLLNIREDAAALLQVTSAEQVTQKRPSPDGAVSPAKKMCFFTPVKNLV